MIRDLRSDESGQTFIEWLGLMAFIVVLVGVVIAAAPEIGHKITDVINSALDALPV
jgi:Flp pilus assembly pilin Flp